MKKLFCFITILIFSITGIYSQNTNSNNFWEPIDLKNWKQVSYIKGKIATEEDLKKGRAVFHLGEHDKPHSPLGIKLPALGYVNKKGENKKGVVIIQAEKVGDKKILGVRYIKGGKGIYHFSEIKTVENVQALKKAIK